MARIDVSGAGLAAHATVKEPRMSARIEIDLFIAKLRPDRDCVVPEDLYRQEMPIESLFVHKEGYTLTASE